jgi:hypothetical protein
LRSRTARWLSILLWSVALAGGCELKGPVGTHRIDASTDGPLSHDGSADLHDGGSDGSEPRGWVIAAGGSVWDAVVDDSDSLFVLGQYAGETKLEGVGGELTLPDRGGPSSFIARLDTKVRRWVWAVAVDGVPVALDAETGLDGFGIDAAGNIFHAGRFSQTATFGGVTLTSAGDRDLFVTKRDPDSGEVLWAVSAGGAGRDGANALAVGKDGKITICGWFSGTAQFPGLSTSLVAKGHDDLFVARLDPADGAFDWAVPAGSDSTSTTLTPEYAMAVAVDGPGNSYITGSVGGGAAFGAKTLSGTAGERQAYVAKVDPAGSFLWAASLDGIHGAGIARDTLGDIYVVAGSHLPPNVPQHHWQGQVILVFRGYEKGTQWQPAWPSPASAIGGEPPSLAVRVLVDGQGNSAVAGVFTSDISFGASSLTASGTGHTGFLAFLDPAGKFTGAEDIPSTTSSTAIGLARDQTGGLYVVGSFQGTADFGGNPLTSRSASTTDGFVWYTGRGPGTF